jgi:hypothetical protein
LIFGSAAFAGAGRDGCHKSILLGRSPPAAEKYFRAQATRVCAAQNFERVHMLAGQATMRTSILPVLTGLHQKNKTSVAVTPLSRGQSGSCQIL